MASVCTVVAAGTQVTYRTFGLWYQGPCVSEVLSLAGDDFRSTFFLPYDHVIVTFSRDSHVPAQHVPQMCVGWAERGQWVWARRVLAGDSSYQWGFSQSRSPRPPSLHHLPLWAGARWPEAPRRGAERGHPGTNTGELPSGSGCHCQASFTRKKTTLSYWSHWL